MRLFQQVKIVRLRVILTGHVQGVGVRYYILKLAEQHKVKGFVANVDKEVWIEIEGEETLLNRFVRAIKRNPTPFGIIRSIVIEQLPLQGARGFHIRDIS